MNFEIEGLPVEDVFNFVVWGVIFAILVVQFLRSIRLVPTMKAYVVERLGKYHKTLGPGFHSLLPFIDNVAFIQDLKEESIEVPPQECFTKDNVQVEVDGVIYISVSDPVKASYGVTDYRYAAIQLAQTTTRSVLGTLDLDSTFEERNLISSQIVEVLTQAANTWGIKVHRYEIKNIEPPHTVKNAMEKQVTAERERRAIVARSEGDKESRINHSEGLKAELINKSEGEMQKRINEAEGKASEIASVSEATAKSIELLAGAINTPGGDEAVLLQLGEKYIHQLGNLANNNTNMVIPADITDIHALLDNLGLNMQDDAKKPKGK